MRSRIVLTIISFNNNNNISPNKENKNPSANFKDRTCSFWPAHVETQNQNGIYIFLLIGNYVMFVKRYS